MAIQRRAMIGLMLGSIVLTCLACNSSPTEPEMSISFQTVLKSVLPGDPSQQPDRVIIRDQSTWQAVWADLYERQAPPPLPQVDFDREMIALAVGPGCCGNVEIQSIEQGQGEILVRGLSEASPNTICVLADFSVHVVRLPRIELPGRFEMHAGVKAC